MVAALITVTMCPSCPAALEARGRVLSEAFWENVIYVVLPFVVVGFVVGKLVKRLDRGVCDEE